jgi:hypothetical protein
MEPARNGPPVNGFKTDPATCVGVLINPWSGGNRNGAADLRRAVAEYPRALQRDVRRPADVAAAIRIFAGRRVKLIVVSGGDGTVQAVLTALFHLRPFETPPPLMILQAGTTSMTALDVGVRGSQQMALQRLFRRLRSGKGWAPIIERPVLRVQVPGHGVRCGMFFGAGGICRAIEYFHRHRHIPNFRGRAGILLTMIRFIPALFHANSTIMPPTRVTVRLDHRPRRQIDAAFVFVSTLERLLLGLFPFWGTGTGALNYTDVASPIRHPLRVLPFLAMGRRNPYGTSENGYTSHRVDAVYVHADTSVTLDGQIYTPTTAKDPTVVRCGGHATFLRL